ncbi:DUF3151 family protein [Aciditerrimonas ferrireducens]|uniref:DUF3151 family protein n=1 Tax=Aciditerrimonas ferrireducens TaxID=667306 RepID=UPI0020065D1C|nr:DUF3151 family protein [Aciditerrimonas ferrireducens]MCK4177248.1 DUF3151 domain-containing protein [Aciditerrimonas ferrireducens]
MSAQEPLQIGSRPPETELPEAPAGLQEALARALARDPNERRDAIAEVVRRAPWWSEAWAALGDHSPDPLDAYACYRVGYHRGLDQLRAAGWRGSGLVRAAHPGNRGFLAALAGLARAAEAIGEQEEAERCRQFLAQLDPTWGRQEAGAP